LAHCETHHWWFGYVHYAQDLADHPMIAPLGPDFMSLTSDEFKELLHGRRGGIKSFLLNQKQVAGIGNVYVQDPLFKAGIHPLRPIHTLSDDEINALYHAMRATLQESIDHGGAAYELNLYGQKGGWDEGFLLIAYQEGKSCPTCGTAVEKIKTGSTHTHICPACQPV
jgi:formamidopyrimidine-DNA glycosylase